MNKISLNLDSSIEWLNSGKTLIHPTESIWGIGCDAFNKDAVENIFKLKKRHKNKSFILLVESLDAIEKYLQKINIDDQNYLMKYWPGAYTFLIKYNNKLPIHLHNESGKIAIRVSNHLPINTLIKAFSGFMVSTSANISGEKNINNPIDIINFFECEELAYYDESLGKNTSPSKIIDLETKAIIRE